HRRRWSKQSLVNKQLDLNATILSTTFFRVVLSNRIQLAIAKRRDDPTQRNAVALDQVTDNRISATLTQLPIEVHSATRIREAGSFGHVALRVHRLGGDGIEGRFRFRRKHGAA